MQLFEFVEILTLCFGDCMLQ